VSLILHLSDLHLGSPSGWQLDYDDKVGVGRGGGNTNISHLRRTIRTLGRTLDQEGRQLDAVAITGDLTKGNKPDGYAEFADVLAELGPVMPEPDRILVVPGNHDVDRDVPPGDPRKLAQFLDAVRPSYRSPLIKGLDYDGGSLSLDPEERGDPQPILLLEDLVLVAISSADYCGHREEQSTSKWDEIIAAYRAGDEGAEAEAARKVADEELKGLRTYDMPQVDYRQLEALGERLDALGVSVEADRDPRLRIAALHHPIGVAASRLEIKPFETITNLAEVRSFLRDRGFHLVIHGHKHESHAAWEWLVPPGEELGTVPHRVLVLGSPGQFRQGQTACRLIQVSPDDRKPVAGAPRARITNVRVVRAGEPLRLRFQEPCLSLAQPFMQSSDVETPWVVRARTADAAYQQLRDLPADEDVRRPVISVVEHPDSALQPPSNYGTGDDLQDLEDLVEWWQLPRPEAVRTFSGSEFNHGERLYAGSEDAIERAVAALPSSKAIALLVDPREAGHREREFPAFTALQLQPRKVDGGNSLDIVGIYRKQDLELWWPVNMAELASIQSRAVDLARDREVLEGSVEAGRLIAIATFGVHDDVLPQMAGTALDRAVDLRPEWLYELAHLAAHPNADSEREWGKALGDIGLREKSGLLVPAIGINRLLDALRVHSELAAESPPFEELITAVEDLAKLSHDAEDALRDRPRPRRSTLDTWGNRLRAAAEEVHAKLRSRLENGESTRSHV
jgi:predicted phosphodiesterase